jgi:hypothetical protein
MVFCHQMECDLYIIFTPVATVRRDSKPSAIPVRYFTTDTEVAEIRESRLGSKTCRSRPVECGWGKGSDSEKWEEIGRIKLFGGQGNGEFSSQFNPII